MLARDGYARFAARYNVRQDNRNANVRLSVVKPSGLIGLRHAIDCAVSAANSMHYFDDARLWYEMQIFAMTEFAHAIETNARNRRGF